MRHTYPRLASLEAVEALLKERFDDTFLNLGDLPDPSQFKDMDRAVDRIIRAIQEKERIVLVGDYDVDGVSATAIMSRFFEQIGVMLEWIIPNRFRDGYGLSTTLFPKISHADLVITVDNGIAAVEAAELCREAGIDLIITDHHIVPETPPTAYAIVNQKQPECTFPYSEICGAQIAWYLCAALNRRLGRKVKMKELLELAAPAIIADIMPLQHINRAMVRQGLQILEQSQSPFIVAWRERTGKTTLRAEDIAFGLAPLINSAGRMEDASVACDYLCAGTLPEARRLLARLEGFNERRKGMEEMIFQEALGGSDPEAPILLAVGEAWHEGVLGIVAARLARRFERPAIVLTRTAEGYKGSGRSFGTCHLFDLVQTQREFLEKFGGHAAAIGLSLRAEALESFASALTAEATRHCVSEDFRDPEILGEIDFDLLNWELYRLLERYEPYGEGNPRPKFITRNVQIEGLRQLGSDGQHLKMLLRDGASLLEGIQFRFPELPSVGENVDLLYTLNENRFNGRSSLQLLIEKVQKS
ncbi:single-stranded-DNA-specific exonuclease RecJ [Nitratifractor sp.]|uniref:single-stranded-DNA-specific exonuclease RecJ n=1 Tax=Nitratifractor sp. TaxID=2268144 RepID=UPI0025ED9385|nr:single-stranded-DNA-specific exonuclease RecJ [Nitratifractor sp.]